MRYARVRKNKDDSNNLKIIGSGRIQPWISVYNKLPKILNRERERKREKIDASFAWILVNFFSRFFAPFLVFLWCKESIVIGQEKKVVLNSFSRYFWSKYIVIKHIRRIFWRNFFPNDFGRSKCEEMISTTNITSLVNF